ncbi:MAG: alpha/beta hydrolase [Bacillota bacterium]
MRNLIFIAVIALFFVFLALSLFRKRMKGSVKALSIVGSFVLIAATFCLWAFPSWEFPEITGPYEVAGAVSTYTDERRVETYEEDGSARWLNVAFWYPKNYSGDKNTCPIIVFSHGSFGVKQSNESLYRELASHGYVVCAIDHTYQCVGTTGPDGKTVPLDNDYRKQVMSASDSDEKSREQLYAYFTEWMSVRMGDIDFVLDTIIARSAADDTGAGGAYLLMDTSRIGVMGHSIGGSAALGIGRTRGDVGAVIALEAPFMYDVSGVENGNLVFRDPAYPVPLLSVYTDSSWGIIDDSPQYAQNKAIRNDRSDTTYDLYVKNAGHMTLTDLAYSMPPLCLMFGQNIFLDAGDYVQKLNRIYLEFFDCYLKKEGSYTPVSFE